MASRVVELVEPLVEKYAQELGLEIVEVEYIKKPNGFNLTIFIDKQGGITIDDCEKLHNLIDEPLDELNPTNNQPYILNVSSCGLDRPLKTIKDYIRCKGREVEVKFYAPYDGKKSYIGFIDGVVDENLVINNNGQTYSLPINKIAAVLPIINF